MVKKRKQTSNYTPILFSLLATFLIGVALFGGRTLSHRNLSSPDNARAQQTFSISSLPTNIRTTSLDSSIRLEWDPVVDDRIAWQVVTARDSSAKIVGTKVVGPTGRAVDINGLRTGERYSLSLQLVSKTNELSRSVDTAVSTILQLPMRNAIFFDNFNDGTHGPMDSNYYDVRTFTEFGDTATIPDAINTMVSERHYHTQLIESNGDGGVHARARVPVSLSNTATFQFETDIPAIQDGPGQENNSHGKWWVVAFSNKIVNTHQDFTHGMSDPGLVSIDFSAYGKRSADRNGTNLAKIGVISNGQRKEFIGTKPLISPQNVRVPVTVTVSRSTAVMYVNGEKVVEATGLSLPISEGYWSVGQANYRSGFIDIYGNGLDQPRVTNQLIHWDTIQFDGANARNFIPSVKTYQAPTCTGPVWFNMRGHQIQKCPYLISRGKLSSDFTISINEDLSKVRTAKLLLNGPHNADVIVTANNIEIARFAPNNDRLHVIHSKSLSATQLQALRRGSNAIRVFTSSYNDYRGVGAFQLEVVYDTPKTFANPPLESSVRLAAVGTDFSFDKKNHPGGIARGVSYIYSTGSDEVVNYSIKMHSSNTPWLRILSPLTGQARPIVNGGTVIPIEFEVNFNTFVNPHSGDTDKPNGQLGIIRVEGTGATSRHPIEMPVSIVALAVDYEMPNRPANFYPLSHYTPSLFSFNRAALPPGDETLRQYFSSVPNTPPTTPGPVVTPVPTLNPTSSATIIPISTPIRTPSPTPVRTQSPAPTPLRSGSPVPKTPTPAPATPIPNNPIPNSPVGLYKAVNFNGATAVVNGIEFQSESQAGVQVSGNRFSNQNVLLIPHVSSSLAAIIRSSVWGSGGCCSNYPRISMPNIPLGNYRVYVYTWEDTVSETFDMYLEQALVLDNYPSGEQGSWKKHGPYNTNITDGTLNVDFRGGNVNVSAIELWRLPVVSQEPAPTEEIPLVIQAEDYIDAFDTTSGNTGGVYRSGNADIQGTSDTNGGYNIGWTRPGEWLRYSFTSASGTYVIRSRVAHTQSGAQFRAHVDSAPVGSMTIPGTGDWQRFTTIESGEFFLSEGNHTLEIYMDRATLNGSVGNYNYFEVHKVR